MQPPRHKEARHLSTAIFGLLLAIALLPGCGGAAQGERSRAEPLLQGALGSGIDAADRDAGARRAISFGRTYARVVYQRNPPRLPGATLALTHRLAEAATRVPPHRRGLHPRAIGVSLVPAGPAAIHGTVTIADGHSLPFSVGFTLERRDDVWRVVAASPPG